MIITVEIAKIKEHIFILNSELKEIHTILEILKTIYQNTEHPKEIRRQISFFTNEKACVKRKIAVLETAIQEFLKTKNEIHDDLIESKDILEKITDFIN